MGQSIRKISREENRTRETVTKIIRNEDMRAYVTSLREKFYGLGNDALAAVHNALVRQKDAQIGYRLLENIGVVPSVAERELIQANQEVVKKEDLNEWEEAFVGDADGIQGQIKIGVARMMQRRAEVYASYKLPSPQELRRNHAIQVLIDNMCNGKAGEVHSLTLSDRERLKREIEAHLQQLAKAGGVAAVGHQSELQEPGAKEIAPIAPGGQVPPRPSDGPNGEGKFLSRLRLNERDSS